MLKGNKGEWSEIYALFKLLGDKVLYPGDANTQRIENLVYPIICILRTESKGTYSFNIKDDIVLISEKSEFARINVSEFKEKAEALFAHLRNSKEDAAFSIPEIEAFMSGFECKSLKASSSVKTDITIVIHDIKTNQQPALGFSIKSQMGGASTLFNAIKGSNFIFEVTGIDHSTIPVIQSLIIKKKNKDSKDVKGRTQKIYELGGHLHFLSTQNVTFENNLTLIDSQLPKILSEIIIKYFRGESKILNELVDSLEQDNPLGFNMTNGHKYYTYKIKRLLTDIAVGMLPSKVWDGTNDATGGYLIVKDDGETVCYHLYNRNEFENYLLNNTILDTPSSSKHDFGDLSINEEGQMTFKLNFQIRFNK